MRSIAVYSLKGGVGKTTIAVTLAWASASLSSRKTLLWDLDAQGAASFLLDGEQSASEEARAVFARDVAPSKLARPTIIPRLDLLPADASLRGLDHFLFSLGKKKRLEKLLERLAKEYDRIFLDCPPGLTETSEQVMRAADLILVPVIPSPLSRRALEEVVDFLDRRGIRHGSLLPVYNMADRRRSIHLAALEENPDWPVVPMSSAIEAMSTRDHPIGTFARGPAAGDSLTRLWQAIERKLAKSAKAS
jgi:cellulose biosynthesis protein BcsQ